MLPTVRLSNDVTYGAVLRTRKAAVSKFSIVGEPAAAVKPLLTLTVRLIACT